MIHEDASRREHSIGILLSCVGRRQRIAAYATRSFDACSAPSPPPPPTPHLRHVPRIFCLTVVRECAEPENGFRAASESTTHKPLTRPARCRNASRQSHPSRSPCSHLEVTHVAARHRNLSCTRDRVAQTKASKGLARHAERAATAPARTQQQTTTRWACSASLSARACRSSHRHAAVTRHPRAAGGALCRADGSSQRRSRGASPRSRAART